MRLKDKKRGFLKGFCDAFSGIKTAVREERNLRVHICMMAYVVFFSIIGEVSKDTFLKFLILFGIVLSAEAFNSAIERLCDVVSEEFDLRIKSVKDISAGAVLVSAVSAASVGLFVFLSSDVLETVFGKFAAYPLLAVLFVISVPVAVLFIIKRGK